MITPVSEFNERAHLRSAALHWDYTRNLLGYKAFSVAGLYSMHSLLAAVNSSKHTIIRRFESHLKTHLFITNKSSRHVVGLPIGPKRVDLSPITVCISARGAIGPPFADRGWSTIIQYTY